MAQTRKLRLSFYRRDTTLVARELLGKTLVRVFEGHRLAGRITEVEAYLGVRDRACHSFAGRRTPRNQAMYTDGGHAYIYLIYGIHWCFNVVTQREDCPEAVLIRAIEPLEGIEVMQRFRQRAARKAAPKSLPLRELGNGPGKLGQALALSGALNGVRLDSDELFLERGPKIADSKIVVRPRIGVDYAGEHAAWPLRFYIAGNSSISKR